MRIPVICSNNDCHLVFPGDLDMVNAINVTFIDCASGKCPQCGSPGRILDGTYNAFENNIFATLRKTNDIVLLRRIAISLKKDLTKNKSPQKIKNKLDQQFPKLKPVWDLIPDTRQDAYNVINIILAIIMMLMTAAQCSKKEKENIINQTFQNYFFQNPSNQRNTPFDSRIEGTDISTKPEKI